MRRAAGVAFIALLAAATVAAAANSPPWRVRTVPTTTATFLRGLEVLPGGRTAIVLQRRAGGRNRLELHDGRRSRALDVSRHAFIDADVGHDRRGRLVVAWRRIARTGGAIQLFVWTTGARTRQLSSLPTSANSVSLDVAPNGRAIVAASSQGQVLAWRRAPGRRFGPPRQLTPERSATSDPAASIAGGGRAVVAWGEGEAVAASSAEGNGPFGTPQVVRLRSAREGHSLVPAAPKIVLTSERRAVVAVSAAELRAASGPYTEPAIVATHVEAFDWAPGAGTPSAARTLSRGELAGAPDLIARGGSALVAWTERADGAAPRALRAAFWAARGPDRNHTYETRELGGPVVLAPAAAGGAQVFYRVTRGHWFTVHLAGSGLFSRTSVVTPPGRAVTVLEADGASRRAVAAWTGKTGRGDSSNRIHLARPAGRR
jgi:hypothetical protein